MVDRDTGRGQDVAEHPEGFEPSHSTRSNRSARHRPELTRSAGTIERWRVKSNSVDGIPDDRLRQHLGRVVVAMHVGKFARPQGAALGRRFGSEFSTCQSSRSRSSLPSLLARPLRYSDSPRIAEASAPLMMTTTGNTSRVTVMRTAPAMMVRLVPDTPGAESRWRHDR
jgi:hypothetical protein